MKVVLCAAGIRRDGRVVALAAAAATAEKMMHSRLATTPDDDDDEWGRLRSVRIMWMPVYMRTNASDIDDDASAAVVADGGGNDGVMLVPYKLFYYTHGYVFGDPPL